MTSSVVQLIADNLTVLRQGKELVTVLDGPAFTAKSPALALSGVGPHLRHVLDCYRRFLDVLEDPGEPGRTLRIDYDVRERDPRLETDPHHAVATLSQTMNRLRAVSSAELDRPLEVRSEGSSWVPTTVARELQSLVSHTIHHFALIAVVLRCQGRDPGPEFGVAPSTLRHWESQRQAEVASA
ncbi:MAG: DinB family protein [Planctomycetota bacterium]|nr:DinB family protein [Planctomycetota bacterium]MEC8513434.1 DinB family protein [Planctomycetota bacterium]